MALLQAAGVNRPVVNSIHSVDLVNGCPKILLGNEIRARRDVLESCILRRGCELAVHNTCNRVVRYKIVRDTANSDANGFFDQAILFEVIRVCEITDQGALGFFTE